MAGFWHFCLEIFFNCLDFLHRFFDSFFVNLGTSYGCGSFLVISKVFILPCCWIILALSDVDISELFYFWNFFFFSTEIFVMSWSKINVFIFWIILGGSVQCASVLHCTGDALLDCCTVRLVGAAGWLPSRNCVWEGPFTNYSNIEGIMLFFSFSHVELFFNDYGFSISQGPLVVFFNWAVINLFITNSVYMFLFFFLFLTGFIHRFFLLNQVTWLLVFIVQNLAIHNWRRISLKSVCICLLQLWGLFSCTQFMIFPLNKCGSF